MKKRTAVLLVVAGMMLNACNPLETAKPIETTAAVSTAAASEATTNAGSALVSLETSATDAAVADAAVDKALVGKKRGETDPPEDLYHYESTCFYYNDEEWFLDIYTSAMPDGEFFAYDDQNRFYVRARYGEYQFEIFDDWVQLGFPEIDIIDEGKTLHIVMTDIRTASYTVTDYSFMEEDFYFQENTLIDLQGINYIGDLDVN